MLQVDEHQRGRFGCQLQFRIQGSIPPNLDHNVSFNKKPGRIEVVELDGQGIQSLTVCEMAEGRYGGTVNIPRFGL